MYESYWGLSSHPFGDEAEPDWFFPSETHQAAFLKMRYLCEQNRGAGLLSGGVGYGKSYLVRLLKNTLAERFQPFLHLLYPQMTADELLRYLAVRLGAENCDTACGTDHWVRQIETQLKSFGKNGGHPVIAIDDADLIEDSRVFRALQLLLNFRSEADIEFSLILIGDRTLLSRLRRIPQLDERIDVKSVLRPLDRDETANYVQHRLQAAGCQRDLFTPGGLDVLYELTGGVPRRINRLGDMGLLVGYADNLTEMTTEEVESVSKELLAVVPD